MSGKMKTAIRAASFAAIALLIATVGYQLGAQQPGGGAYAPVTSTGSAVAPQAAPEALSGGAARSGVTAQRYGSDVLGNGEWGAVDEQSADKYASTGAPEQDSATATERVVIRNGSVELRVEKIDSALEKLRQAASATGAEIQDLVISAGSGDVKPLPYAAQGGMPSGDVYPASASITLRVPADKLDQLRARVAKLGVVLSENVSATDVTTEYVDLEARLKNMQAEEVRLRKLLDRAGKVTDLLQVERELARVRGEIEAMTAQLRMMSRQAAKATLTVTMTEPGPVVQPQGTDWGFADAVRRGVQSAASLMTSSITVLIALSPAIVVGVVLWFVLRAIVRRRTRKARANAAPEDEDEQGL